MGNKPISLIYDIESGQNKVISKQNAIANTQWGAWELSFCL